MLRSLSQGLFLVLAALLATAQLSAQLSPVIQESGNISVSIDAGGNNDLAGYTVQVDKPAGATVRSAYLSACSLFSRAMANGDVSIDGTPIDWDLSVLNNAGGTPGFFNNVFSDVTTVVAPTIDAAAPGLIDFTMTEVDTATINGSVLVVIFDDPAAPNSSALILFGGQNTTGDAFTINLANPIDPNAPGAVADMSLAIGHGFQGTGPTGTGMDSEITVNGTRMTSSAGGEDDGEAANGALITAGGIGDSNGNPADPFAPSTMFADDDELYSMLPFLTATTTAINVDTFNPSDDDNVFMAVFTTSVPAAIGESILLSPVNATRDLGTSYTATARVVDDNNDPVVGRQVTIQVQSGPNAATSATGTTDANGEFSLSYVGTAAGTDSLIADMINSQGMPQNSNTAEVLWTNPPECFLIVGVEPVNVPLGPVLPAYATNQDVLLVNPILLTTMSLTNLPEFVVPSNAPLGASIYTQGLLMNPWVFPNDPIKLSQAIEWQVGTSTTPYGAPNGLFLWSTSPAAVQPGQTITMSFTIL